MATQRWTLATITTTDEELIKLFNEVREHGHTHEAIYRRGLEELKREIK
jgi:hypothetical protein